MLLEMHCVKWGGWDMRLVGLTLASKRPHFQIYFRSPQSEGSRIKAFEIKKEQNYLCLGSVVEGKDQFTPRQIQ